LLHVGAFNLSLIFRSLLGAGTPRELRNRLASFSVTFFSVSAYRECQRSLFPGHESTDRRIAAIFVTCSVIRKNLIPPRAARECSNGNFPGSVVM